VLTTGGYRRSRPENEGQRQRFCKLAGSVSAGGGARRVGAGRRAGGGVRLWLTRARGVRLAFIGRGQEPRMPPGGGGAGLAGLP
jgi:hypothetical protein